MCEYGDEELLELLGAALTGLVPKADKGSHPCPAREWYLAGQGMAITGKLEKVVLGETRTVLEIINIVDPVASKPGTKVGARDDRRNGHPNSLVA